MGQLQLKWPVCRCPRAPRSPAPSSSNVTARRMRCHPCFRAEMPPSVLAHGDAAMTV